jgi:hypothetical protein
LLQKLRKDFNKTKETMIKESKLKIDLIEKMNFLEIWDYLKKTDPDRLKELRKRLQFELNISDAGLRKRKRLMKFNLLERAGMTEVFQDFFQNTDIERNILFPQTIEQYVN